METLDKLKELLKGPNGKSKKDWFDEIAKILFEEVAIKADGKTYLFKEIEFYYYCKDHRDIITHPRNCKAMQWFINDFGGIDLTFESNVKYKQDDNRKDKKEKPVLEEDSYFGGILIRQLQEEKSGRILSGPLSCAELFRLQDSVGNVNCFPKLIPLETKRHCTTLSEARTNVKIDDETKIEKKIKYLMTYTNDLTNRNHVKDYKEFMDKPYKYKL